jgi:hypothetical protein
MEANIKITPVVYVEELDERIITGMVDNCPIHDFPHECDFTRITLVCELAKEPRTALKFIGSPFSVTFCTQQFTQQKKRRCICNAALFFYPYLEQLTFSVNISMIRLI